MEIKRYLDVAWRRRWWVVVPTVVAAAVSLVLVAVTPKAYRAETTILVTRQSVSEDILRSTVTLRIEERMRSLQVQIFSRTYLEAIAREFKMIPAGATEREVEEAYLRLRANITPDVDRRDFSWFRISVDDADPARAAGIANRLAELFIEQNSRMRASQATGTLEATEGWAVKYRAELAERDREIAEFKQRNIYELPDQQPVNLQLLNSAQLRVAQLTSEIQSRTDRVDALQGQQQARSAAGGPSAFPIPGGLEDARLTALRSEVAVLRETYTEENPLVKRKRDQIAELAATLPPPTAEGPGVAAAAARLDPLSMQIYALQAEIRGLEADRSRENASIGMHRARLANAPQHQQRLLELTRDYDTVKQQFDTVVAQNEQAQRSQDLEASKRGEQFQIQDRAYTPAVPYKPDLGAYLLMGLAVGVGLGVCASVARELTDQTVRNEEDFSSGFLDMPIYGVIPDLDFAPASRGPMPRLAPVLRPVIIALLGMLT